MRHPLREAILARLGEQVYSPNELAVELDGAAGERQHHVTVLRELGLVELVDTAPRRGAVEHYYRAKWRVRVEVDQVG